MDVLQTLAMVNAMRGGGGSGGGGGGGTGGGDNFPIGDGNTHIWISLGAVKKAPRLGVCVNGTVTVYWGDDTEPDVLVGTGTNSVVVTPAHQYKKAGLYVVTLIVDGSMWFYGTRYSSGGCYLLRDPDENATANQYFARSIKHIEMGSAELRDIDGVFAEAGLAGIVIPDGTSKITYGCFKNCQTLGSVVFPGSVEVIGDYAFQGAIVYCYDFSKHTSVPTLSSTNAIGTGAPGCEIRVPAALYDEWVAATNWSALAGRIVGV